MKSLKKFFALLLSVITVFTFTACGELIINGSKITKASVTLEFYNEEGQVEDTKTATLYLYQNNAPITVAHVTELIKSGYYDNTCVSHVADTWIEFGAYNYDANGQMVAKDYQGTSYSKEEYNGGIKGEFEKNGFANQTLSVSSGALVLKHDYKNDGEVSKYNTGKATIAVCFSSSTNFSKSEYAVFGKVVMDDAKKKPADYEDVSDVVDRTYMSSLEIFKSVLSLVEDENDLGIVTTTYYYEKENQVYTSVYDANNGETDYYKGYADGTLLNETEEEALVEKLEGSDANYFLVVPSTRVVIKSVKIVK